MSGSRAIVVLLAAALAAPALAAPARADSTDTTGGVTAPVADTTRTDACQQGKALEALGRWDAAATAYAAGLATPADAECAQEALQSLQDDGKLCVSADALKDAGLDDQARTAYAALLKDQPASGCASRGLEQDDEAKVVSWLKQAASDVGDVLAAVALALLLAALLAWALLCLATHTRGLKRLPGLRHLRQVRLQLKGLEDGQADKLGAGTTEMLRARLVNDAGNTRVALASGPTDTGALGGLADVSDQARIVVALLTLLRAGMPKRDWIVTGVLQGASADGLGLALTIDNGGRYTAFGEFWAKLDCGPVTDDQVETYRRLTIPAAGWLGHHVAAANDPRALLSTSADSWALFSVGLHWYDRGERDVARDFYARAIAADGGNIAALTNLGVMDAENGRADEAERLLRLALELLEQ